MVSKKDRDAEAGLQVFWIMSIVWLMGFLYWYWEDVNNPASENHVSTMVCSILNLIAILVLIALWLYTYRENKVKAHIEEYLEEKDSVTARYLAEKFSIKYRHAYRALYTWAEQSGAKGKFDRETGRFIKKG